MLNAAASQAGPAPGPSVERVRVPLLSELLGPAALGTRRVWADLGRAQEGLIARLAGSPNRLIVADLPNALTSDEACWHLPDTVLSGRFWSEPVNRFLCWDLLNYMRRDQLAELSARIALRGGSDCTIHALIQYSAKTMPEIPGHFNLDEDLQLSVSAAADSLIGTPRYSPKALEKAMPELRVERTMLLNNGMQEFLFSPR